MSSLFWIDDSINYIMPMVESVFPLIWEDNHSIIVALFGNEYCKTENEMPAKETDRASFEAYIKNIFIHFCSDVDAKLWRPDGKTYKEKRDLVKGEIVKLIPISKDTNLENGGNLFSLVEKWTDDSILKTISPHPEGRFGNDVFKEHGMDVNGLVSAMKIPDGAVVAIDVCLLSSDLDRLRANLPVISMAIFNCVRNSHPTFLYSGEALPIILTESWKSVYNSFFYNKEGEDFKIYSRTNLARKGSSTMAKQELRELFREGDNQ